MNYKLYYAPGSAAMGVRVLLEEIGVSYELINTTIAMDEPRPIHQLELNPNGWVPVLIWDDKAMYECAAITIFLCDRHEDAKLAPLIDDPERGLYLQTLVYFSSTIQNAFQLTYYPDRFVDNTSYGLNAQNRGISRLKETWNIIDKQIGDNEWILGNKFSAVDIYLFMLTTWLSDSEGHPPKHEFPNVNRVATAVSQRPCVRHVYYD